MLTAGDSRRGRGWRRRPVLAAGVVFALALVAGITGWLASSRPAPDRLPFLEAAGSLAVAPVIHYRAVLPGAGAADVEVTNFHELVGTLTEGGQSYGLLEVGGKVYLKPPDAGLPGITNPAEAAALRGRWVTGGGITGLLGTLPSDFRTPLQLSERLFTALASPHTVIPRAGDPGTRRDGTRVLAASTPLGVLEVTARPPYRLVSLVPGTGRGRAAAAVGQPPAVLTSAGRASGGGAASPDALDFPADGPSGVTSAYGDLEADTSQLSGAVDSDLQFSMDGNGTLSCGDAGCAVTATVQSDVGAGAGTVTGGTVSASMTATVAIEGEAAGGCAAAGTLPLDGTGELSCFDSGAGGVFAAVDAQKRAEAQAQSEAEDGAAVPYQVDSSGEFYVYAVARVEVAQQIQDEQQQEDADEGASPCGAGLTAASVPPVLTAGPPCRIAVGNGIYQYPDGSLRYASGRFAGSTGSNVGGGAEQDIWNQLEAKGLSVARGRIYVTGNGGQVRVYDGAVERRDGNFYGIEIKSGGARMDAQQRAFDSWVEAGNVATGIGQSNGIRIIGTVEYGPA